MENYLNYQGKVCVVTGAASGMGKATAEALVGLGAVVYALDVQPVELKGIEQYVPIDLSNKESIKDAFEKLPNMIDCFFSVAGLRGATLLFMKVAKINLIANKFMLEELLPARMREGGSIAIVTSSVGIGWELEGNKKYYCSILEARGWDATVDALEASGLARIPGGFAYVYTKMATNYLVAKMQNAYANKKVRLNALLPGQTATNFGSEDQQAANVTQGKSETYAGYAGRSATAEEMAKPLLFLCSDMASYISGAYLNADYGMSSEIVAGLCSNPLGGTIEQMLSGK